jgi:hypothetical protein
MLSHPAPSHMAPNQCSTTTRNPKRAARVSRPNIIQSDGSDSIARLIIDASSRQILPRELEAYLARQGMGDASGWGELNGTFKTSMQSLVIWSTTGKLFLRRSSGS